MRGWLLVLVLFTAPLAGDAREQRWISPYVSKRLAAYMEDVDDGRTRQALAGFEELASRVRRGSGDHVLVVRQWTAILFELGRHDEARTILADAVEDLDEEAAAPLRLALAQVRILDEDFEAADRELRRWLEGAATPSPQGLFLAGYVRFMLERHGEADALIARAMAATDLVPASWIEVRTFALLRDGRPADAEALIAERLAGHPEETRWWRHLARLALDAEDYDAATVRMAILDAATELDVRSVRRLAGLFASSGIPERGARLLERALELDAEPADADDWTSLARLWISAREFEAAEGALLRAAELDESPEALVTLGRLHLHRERYEAALEVLDAALARVEEAPSAETAWYFAVAAWNLGEKERARSALKIASRHPRYAEQSERLLRQLGES